MSYHVTVQHAGRLAQHHTELPPREVRLIDPDGTIHLWTAELGWHLARRCQTCGKQLNMQRSTKRFCSERCRVAAHRAAHSPGGK